MDISLPPTKRIRVCHLDGDYGHISSSDISLSSKHHLLSQPVEHLQLVISYLTPLDLALLISVNRLFHAHITKSEIYLKEILHHYCKLPVLQTESMYCVQMFNRNLAAILYDSYYHFIADHWTQIKEDVNFQLIPKKDIIPLNIFDVSQKDYFSTFAFLFDALGLWNHTISVLFHPLRFNRLCLFNDTKIFKAYSRLLSYNFISMFPAQHQATHTYTLVPIHTKMNQIARRAMNYYEQILFKPFTFPLCEYDRKDCAMNSSSNLIVDHRTFIRRMNQRFGYYRWKHFVDWSQFWLIGGSVLKCVLKESWNEADIDLDFFANDISYNEYVAEMKEFVERCRRNGYKVLSQITNCKQSVHDVYVNFDGAWQKFQFVWYDSMGKSELMNVIDIDCTQIGFDGRSVWCTYACIQSIATKTMISYKLVENCKDLLKGPLDRILKYKRRGFRLIVPYGFREQFLLDAMTYRQENEKKSNEQNDKQRYERFMLNNDTMKVRNKFIEICRAMLL